MDIFDWILRWVHWRCNSTSGAILSSVFAKCTSENICVSPLIGNLFFAAFTLTIYTKFLAIHSAIGIENMHMLCVHAFQIEFAWHILRTPSASILYISFHCFRSEHCDIVASMSARSADRQTFASASAETQWHTVAAFCIRKYLYLFSYVFLTILCNVGNAISVWQVARRQHSQTQTHTHSQTLMLLAYDFPSH